VTTLLARAARASGGLDRRLGAIGAGARQLVVLAVAIGLGQTAAVVIQAVLAASVIQRALLDHAGLDPLGPRLAGLGAALAVRGLLGWAAEWSAERTTATVVRSLRRCLLRTALKLGPGWLASERAGELAVTSTVGAEAVGEFVGRYLPQLILAALAPAAVLVWVGAVDWVSVLLLLVLVALVPVSMVYFGRRAAESSARQWRGLSSLAAHLLELIAGLPTLRAFGRVDYGRREVVEATERLRRSTLRTLRVAFLSSFALELLAGLGVGLVAMVLGLRLLDGRLSLSVALSVLLVSPEVFVPLRRAAAQFHGSAEGRAAGERIGAILATPVAVDDDGVAPVPDLGSAAVSFEAVTVGFAGRGRVLGPLSLRLDPGRRVAIVGPSGSGKSTALHALLGLVPVGGGRITVGDVDLGDIDLEEWRRHLAWVPQRPHLFAGTVGDNVRFGDPSAAAAALSEALAVSGLDDVLERLPHGLETPVGEAGAALSAGERQRIAIARAVLHGGDIVLLDEFGSHLDEDSRVRLQASTEGWLGGRTVLLASHRPDVVSRLDDVVVLGPVTRAPVGTP
jgi:thiol reductant ABC exporter CydD subunit